jgi:PAS domain S-box-containing protein
MYRDRPDVLEDFRQCFTKKTPVKRESLFRLVTTGESKYFAITYAFIPPEFVFVHTEDIDDRKQAEKALRKNESKHRTLLEHLPQKIFHKDRHSVYVSCNENYARDLKIKSEEIKGKTDYEFYPKKLAEQYRADDKKIMASGKMENIEEKYIQDGQEVWVNTAKTPIKDEKGNVTGILGIFWDITPRKRAEEALRKSEEKLDAMLRSIGDHMSMMDKDLNIVWANKTAMKVFGDDIVGKKCFEVYHRRKEPCEPYPCLTLKAFQDGKVHEHDTETIDKDGKISHYHCTANVALRDKEGKPTTVIEISRDITNRKRAEEALRKSREKLAGIIESVPDAMIMMDKEFNIVWTNDIAKGLSGPDLIGSKCYTTYHMRDTVCKPCIVQQCFDDGRVHEFETEMTDTNGNQRIFWCTASVAARAEDGHPAMVVESLRDITKRKHAQTEIEALKQQVEFILGATKTGLDIIDSDYNIRFIDPEWKKVYGDPADRKCYEYFMDNSEPCSGCGITKAMETKAPVVTEEVLAKEANRPIQVTTIPFQNDDGEWLFAEVNVDITERKQAEEALREREAVLEARTIELEETNSALRVLLKRMDKDKKAHEEKVTLNLKELVLPHIEKLKRNRLDAKSMVYLSLLESNLNDIVSPFLHSLSSKYLDFTPTEIQVASLVRYGKTTKDIAELLDSSYRTIESHRFFLRILSVKIQC